MFGVGLGVIHVSASKRWGWGLPLNQGICSEVISAGWMTDYFNLNVKPPEQFFYRKLNSSIGLYVKTITWPQSF